LRCRLPAFDEPALGLMLIALTLGEPRAVAILEAQDAPMAEEPQTSQQHPARSGAGPAQATVERGLIAARATVVVPVVLLALAALGAFLYATYVFGDSARRVVEHPVPVGNKVGLFLVVIDLSLVGTTLLIAAIGLYELFLTRRETEDASHLPNWLAIRDLNDLKARVISMIVLVAAVTFVEAIVDTGPGGRILDLGIAIAAVIVALTAFVRLSEPRRTDS
jgi:uncharacterized membrane protein YqhA